MIDLVTLFALGMSYILESEETDEDNCLVESLSPTHYQDCHEELGTFRKIRNYFFFIFVPFKCLSFAYKLVFMVKRYHTTYGTYNLPEVYFVVATLIKVMILLPNYFFVEINTIYAVFCLNSLCSYWLTYILS